MPLEVAHILRAHSLQFEEIAVSPDDREALVVFGSYDMPHEDYAQDNRDRSLWRVGLANGDCTCLAAAEEDARAPAWSPDGQQIAYVSRSLGRSEVWVMDRGGDGRRCLTSCANPYPNPLPVWPGPAYSRLLHWSADGRQIACAAAPRGGLYAILQQENWRPCRDAEREGTPYVLGTVDPRIEREAAERLRESMLLVLHPQTGESHVVSHITGDGAYRILGWYPDGMHLLVGLAEILYRVDIASGERRPLFSGPAALARLEGDRLFIAQAAGAQVQVGCVEGESLDVRASVAVPEDFILLDWTPDREILFGCVEQGMRRAMVSVSTRNSTVTIHTDAALFAPDAGRIWSSRPPMACLHHSRRALFPCSNPSQPPELWCVGGGCPAAPVSQFCPDLDRSALGEPQVIRYASDGWGIEGLLLLPPSAAGSGPYPTLFFLHGGPADAVSNRFADSIDATGGSAGHWLAAHGYAVFMPNCRGSSGYGPDFEAAISDYREMEAPYADLMAGADTLVSEGIADAARMGLYGASYGAMVAAWVIGQTDRFGAAVASYGSYDRLAMDRWQAPSRESFLRPDADRHRWWLDMETYRRISPLEHITSVTTPIMLIDTGGEAHSSYGGLPFSEMLRALGVETCYVYYPRAFHGGGWMDVYKADYMRRVLAWFNHCLGGEPLPPWFQAGGTGAAAGADQREGRFAAPHSAMPGTVCGIMERR